MADLVHATAIAFGTRGVLLRGPSGCGKSDLALRCISLAHTLPSPGPAVLVADDQVLVEAAEDTVVLRAPMTIAGLLEVRGVGIVRLPHAGQASLSLVVDLVVTSKIERLPRPGRATIVAGVRIPATKLAAFEPSAPHKLVLALNQAIGGEGQSDRD